MPPPTRTAAANPNPPPFQHPDGQRWKEDLATCTGTSTQTASGGRRIWPGARQRRVQENWQTLATRTYHDLTGSKGRALATDGGISQKGITWPEFCDPAVTQIQCAGSSAQVDGECDAPLGAFSVGATRSHVREGGTALCKACNQAITGTQFFISMQGRSAKTARAAMVEAQGGGPLLDGDRTADQAELWRGEGPADDIRRL